MKKRFLQFIKDNKLIISNKPVLLTVSGGVDSMVMTHLFANNKIPFAIAHCNFQLRGQESDNDEKFVRDTAGRLNIPFYSISFETKKYAEENHLSIQHSARNLRYKWFQEIAEQYDYQAIATAHHADDDTETLFINLFRGTGIKGLQGISVKSGIIIRPLLFATRTEIEEYAVKNKIEFRTDSSNDDLHYLRNQVRHKLLPVIRDIQPHFDTITKRNIKRFSEENQILQDHLQSLKNKVLSNIKENTCIDIELLKQQPHNEYLLYVILEPLGFSPQQISDIGESLEKQAGKKFESTHYRLIKDRKLLILINKEDDIEDKEITIPYQNSPFAITDNTIPYKLLFETKDISGGFTIDPSQQNAQLDLDKLQFPLIMRKWRSGDSIYPLGMKGKKKISDLMIDMKLSLAEKDKIMVLCSGNDIIWIPGIRMNEKYKISEKTKKYLTISLLYT